MLSPNVAAIKEHVQALVTLEGTVDTYVNAIRSITLGPQPLPGYPGSTYDPLGNDQALADELIAVQSHCELYVGAKTGLYFWQGGVIEQNASFQSGFTLILSLINEKGTPTAQQLKEVQELFQAWTSYMSLSAGSLQGIHSELITFLNDVDTDHTTLTTGSTSLANQVAGLTNTIESDSLKYLAFPPLMNLVLAVGLQMITALQKVQTAVSQASIDNAAAQTAISGLADEMAALNSKFTAVSTSIQSAQADGLLTVLQELDIQDAQAAWSQLTTYLTTCNLEP